MSRFPVLATISVLLKVLAVLVVLVGFIGGIAAANDTDPFGRSDFNAGVLFLVWVPALISGVVLWAYAEIIAVVLAIEENTHDSSRSLRDQTRSLNQVTQTLTAILHTLREHQPGSDDTTVGVAGGSASSAPLPVSAVSLPARGQGHASLASSGRPSGGARMLLFPPQGTRGQTIRVEVSGVPWFELVNVHWVGDGGNEHLLYMLHATAQGSAVFDVRPDWERAGSRQVVASGSWGTASASFTVVETAGSNHPETPQGPVQ